MEAIRSVKATHEDRLLTYAGVTGIDIGHKMVKGERTSEMAIRIYVEKKRKNVPAAELLPPEIDGVKTDVIEATFVLHQGAMVRAEEFRTMSDTGTYNPLVGGISIGPCKAVGGYVYVGTLGCLVRDRGTGERLALSNYHVMAEKWAAGDSMAQPSRVDGGTCPAKTVGTLLRSVLSDQVDGAVARLNTTRTTDCSITEIGAVAGKGPAAKDMKVRKRGRTTGLTHGIVDSIDATVKVPYDDGTHTLKHQILIKVNASESSVFGQGGDSGSAVVDDANHVVGLYFAGSTDGKIGVANPIDAVLDALNIDICAKPTIKPIYREKWFRPEKLYISEHFKDRFKEVAFEKPPFSEGIDWNWNWLVDPPDYQVPGLNPVQPRADAEAACADCGTVEERVARLEQLATAGGSTPSPLPAPPAKRICADFRNAAPGIGPNPRVVANAKFQVFDYSGAPAAHTRTVNWGGKPGLDAGFRTIVRHSACRLITVTLVSWAQPAKLVAYDATGHVVATATMSVPQGTDQTLTLAGAGIVRVEIIAPANEVVIRRYCHCAKPLKEKHEKFEKFEKIEIKEFKEPKELIDVGPPKVKDAKDLVEGSIPKLKDAAEGPGAFDPTNPGNVLPGAAPAGLEERLARLEALFASQHFIGSELRPDLSGGALLNEPDDSDAPQG